MVVQYKVKSKQLIYGNDIEGETIAYEISQESYNELSSLISKEDDFENLKLSRIFLYKDLGSYEMVIDNLTQGKIVEFGISKDHKYYLYSYDIKKGLDKFLKMLVGMD